MLESYLLEHPPTNSPICVRRTKWRGLEWDSAAKEGPEQSSDHALH